MRVCLRACPPVSIFFGHSLSSWISCLDCCLIYFLAFLLLLLLVGSRSSCSWYLDMPFWSLSLSIFFIYIHFFYLYLYLSICIFEIIFLVVFFFSVFCMPVPIYSFFSFFSLCNHNLTATKTILTTREIAESCQPSRCRLLHAWKCRHSFYWDNWGFDGPDPLLFTGCPSNRV